MELKARMLAFLIGCIGIRLGFVVAAKKLPENIVKWAALPASLLALAWILIYTFDLRPKGAEAGGVIWWNQYRPIHAAMYASFAILAVTRTDLAYIPLLIDVIFGLYLFVRHYWKK